MRSCELVSGDDDRLTTHAVNHASSNTSGWSGSGVSSELVAEDDGHGASDVVEADTPTWRANCRGLMPTMHHGMCYVMLLGWRDRRSSMVCVEMQQNTGVYTGSGRNERNTLRPIWGEFY